MNIPKNGSEMPLAASWRLAGIWILPRRRLAYLGLLTAFLFVLGGCVSTEVLTPPLDLQKEIFLKQDANARKLLDVYDARLRGIVKDHAKTTLAEELEKIQDAEGKARVADILAVLSKVDGDKDTDLGALDKKRAEHTAALDVNKAAFLAMDMKIREYLSKESLSAKDINQLITDLAGIYASFREGGTNVPVNR